VAGLPTRRLLIDWRAETIDEDEETDGTMIVVVEVGDATKIVEDAVDVDVDEGIAGMVVVGMEAEVVVEDEEIVEIEGLATNTKNHRPIKTLCPWVVVAVVEEEGMDLPSDRDTTKMRDMMVDTTMRDTVMTMVMDMEGTMDTVAEEGTTEAAVAVGDMVAEDEAVEEEAEVAVVLRRKEPPQQKVGKLRNKRVVQPRHQMPPIRLRWFRLPTVAAAMVVEVGSDVVEVAEGAAEEEPMWLV